MKKFILALVMVAALALPAMADGPWLPPDPNTNAPGCNCAALYWGMQNFYSFVQYFPWAAFPWWV